MKKLSVVLLVVVLAMCLVFPAVASAATYNARVYAKVGSRVQVGCQPGLLMIIQWTPVKVVGSTGYVDFLSLTGTPKYAKCVTTTGVTRQIGLTKLLVIGGKLYHVFDFRTIGF